MRGGSAVTSRTMFQSLPTVTAPPSCSSCRARTWGRIEGGGIASYARAEANAIGVFSCWNLTSSSAWKRRPWADFGR